MGDGIIDDNDMVENEIAESESDVGYFSQSSKVSDVHEEVLRYYSLLTYYV